MAQTSLNSLTILLHGRLNKQEIGVFCHRGAKYPKQRIFIISLLATPSENNT
jgi:hypothetical protein